MDATFQWPFTPPPGQIYINWISSLCDHLELIGPCELPLTLNPFAMILN
jgi:hypothetical protein